VKETSFSAFTAPSVSVDKIYIRGVDMACLFGHKWNGCKCDKCGKIRDERHDWTNPTRCKCTICGKTQDIGHVYTKTTECKAICKICGKTTPAVYHNWDGDKCIDCGKIRTTQQAEQNNKTSLKQPDTVQSPVASFMPTNGSGLKKVTIYMGHKSAGQIITSFMNPNEIDTMLGELADPVLAQRIRTYAKNNEIAQQMLNIQVPNITSQGEFVAFVNRAFPEASRSTNTDIGVVFGTVLCYFIIAEKE